MINLLILIIYNNKYFGNFFSKNIKVYIYIYKNYKYKC